MRILLIGAGGQLASELQPLLGPDLYPVTRAELDITDALACARILERVQPEAVVNTAAYNLVDKAETEPEAAFAVNGLGPRNLARLCGSAGITLMQISSDHVFGQNSERCTPYLPTDATGPVGAYGVSKLAGELFVQAHCPRHFIVRTCGLYGATATRSKGNFVNTIRRLAAERSELRVVADQFCTPTWTHDLAPVLAALLRTNHYGVYHATNSGSPTWFDVATEIVRLSLISAQVIPITSAEYNAPARRPGYSVLDCAATEAVTGITLRPWQFAIADFLKTP